VADDFRAAFVFVNDPRLAEIAPEAIAKRVYQELGYSAVFIADARALYDPEHPVLCLSTVDAAFFRVAPRDIWGPENNLRLANVDFLEFANAVDAGGVFRGFD
jgi:hypothetical protein